MRFAAQPWLWLVPLLPALWFGLRLVEARGRAGLRRLLGQRAADHVEERRPQLLGWDRFLLLCGLFWLLIALARPQWGASEVTVSQRGSDVVVALDISNSMLAQDVAPSRLERAKTELGSFLNRVQDSRIGLVFFAGAAFVQCPLTLDYGTADLFLKMADTDMLSEQGTNIGAALATARQLLAKGREGQKADGFQAILLVTDGEDLEGDWQKEAEACQKEGIRVIPVGVGSSEGGLIPAVDRQGRPAGYLKDDEGNVVTTHLNLEALDKLGTLGGAGTFRLGVDGLAGDRLFRELQRLGRRDLQDRRVSAYQERFVWPLLAAVACFLARLALRPWRRRAAVALLIVLAALPAAWPGPAAAATLVRGGAAAAAEGRRLYAKGDYEGALSAYQGAVVQAPDDPVLSLAVGETLFRLQKYPEATQEFERALSLTDDPRLRAEALYNRGTAALAGGDAEAAIRALRASLALEPDQKDAMVNLEAALRQQQQQQQQDKDQQKQDQKKQDQQKQDQQKQDQQKQEQQQKQDQQQQQDQQQKQDEQPKQDQQQQQQQQQQQEPQQAQPREGQGTPPPELTDEQAAQILKALDRDEEELKRSLQQRVQGGRPRSGKRW